MAKYEIRIETPADTSGAEKTSKALDQVAASSQKTTAATKQVDSASKENTATQEKQSTSLNRVADGFKKLGNQIPVLGAALNALKNPWTALAAAAAVAVISFRNFKQQVDEMVAAAGKLDPFNNTIRTFFELTQNRKNREKAFADRMAEIGRAAETGESKLARMNTALDRTLDLEAQQDAASKRVALADINAKVQTHKMTEAQAVEARNKVETKFTQRANLRENRRSATQTANLFAAGVQAEQEKFEAAAQLPGANDKLDQAIAAQSKEEEMLKNYEAVGILIDHKRLSRDEAILQRQQLIDNIGELENKGPGGGRDVFLRLSREKLDEVETGITQFDSGRDIQRALVRKRGREVASAENRVQTLESTAVDRSKARDQYFQQFTDSAQAGFDGSRSRAMIAQLGQTANGIEEGIAAWLEHMRRIEAALRLVDSRQTRDLSR